MKLFALICLFIFVSCGLTSQKTSTTFKLTIGALADPAQFPGGLVIYGKSTNSEDHFVQVMDGGLEKNYEIPNGSWHFFAIGWEASAHGPMSGKVYCAKAMNMSLDGAPMDVNLEASNANCANATYGQNTNINPATSEVSFPGMVVETCNDLKTDALNCSENVDHGYLSSYRFIVKSYFMENGVLNNLSGTKSTSCVNVADTTNQLDANGLTKLNIPTGNTSLGTPFNFILKGFFESDCNLSANSKEFVLKGGTNVEGEDFFTKIITNSGLKQIQIFTKTTVDEALGCSGTGCGVQTNSIGFNLTKNSLASDFGGGFILYGKSDGLKKSFGKVLNFNTSNVSVDLPSGAWRFYALGWDTSGSGPMTGKVYCSFLDNQLVSATNNQFELDLSNANCANNYGTTFNDGTNIRFLSLTAFNCNKLNQEILDANNCSYSPNLDTYKNEKGYLKSYEVKLQSFFNDNGVLSIEVPETHVTSTCQNFLDNTTLNVPTGIVGTTPFLTSIVSYVKPVCDDSGGFETFELENGTTTDVLSNTSYVVSKEGPLNKQYLFTKTPVEEICLLNPIETEFSAGSGISTDPYVLCNAKQINLIKNNNLADSFIMGTDIDMILETGFFGNTDSCVTERNSFVPIGYDCTNELVSQFSGNFDGNNKLIKNLVFEKQLNNVGFVGNASGIIQNIRFEQSIIKAISSVGVIVGLCDGCSIANSIVKNSIVEVLGNDVAHENFGLVAGKVSANAVLKNVYAYDSKLRVDGNNVGGVVGHIDTSTLSQSVAENIQIKNNGANSGGVVGFANGSDLSQLASKGYLNISGSNVGGVVGNLQVSTLTYAYMNTFLKTDDGINIGGIVGSSSGIAPTQKTFVAGKIDAKCNEEVISNCKIGCVIGSNLGGFSSGLCSTDSSVDQVFGGQNGAAVDSLQLTSNTSVFSTITIAAGGNLGGAIGEDIWSHVNGMLPRFSHEPHRACHDANNLKSVTDQISDGKGSANNPIIICNVDQFNSIANNTQHYFKVESTLRMGTPSLVSNLSGTFDWNNKIVYDLNVSNGGVAPTGLFKNISNTGVVKNLNIVDSAIGSVNGSTGVVAGVNSGVIENVKVNVEKDDNAIGMFGAIAGENSSVIQNVEVNGNVIIGTDSGGVSYLNSGTISDCHVSMNFNLSPGFSSAQSDNTTAASFGGVSAFNSNLVQKCRSEISVYNESKFTVDARKKIGGLIGTNTGTVKNSVTAEQSSIKLFIESNKLTVGGLVARNEGTILNSYSVGKIESVDYFMNAINAQGGGHGTSWFSHLVGFDLNKSNTVVVEIENSYYLGVPKAVINFDAGYDSCSHPLGSDAQIVTTGVFNSIFGDKLIVTYTNNTSETLTITTSNSTSPVMFADKCPTIPLGTGIESVYWVRDHSMLAASLVGQEKLESDLKDPTTFCTTYNDIAPFVDDFTCDPSDGWDIVSFFGSGSHRIYDTYKSLKGVSTSVSNPPIWMYEPGKYPELLNLDD